MVDEISVADFQQLTLNEKVNAVNSRIGNPESRISHPNKLLDLYGKTIYLVISPIMNGMHISNGFILTWDVGEVKNSRNQRYSKDDEIITDGSEVYVCYDFNDRTKAISLRDFNIIPNSYNNHAAFPDKDSAEAYLLYRKMAYDSNSNFDSISTKGHAFYVTNEDIERYQESKKNKR